MNIVKKQTLSIIYQHPKVLLGQEKINFGTKRWKGFGSDVFEGENEIACAKRELKESLGIDALDISKRGILNFRFQNKPDDIIEIHVFMVSDFSGDVVEGDKLKPEWFYVDEIPFRDMWSDGLYWFPMFLRGSKFKATFLFGKNDEILDREICEVASFE